MSSNLEILEKKLPNGVPIRKILTKQDLDKFRASPIFQQILNFILKLNSSVEGCKTSEVNPKSEIIIKLATLLKNVYHINQLVKPSNTDTRFGNPSYKIFYDKAHEEVTAFFSDIVEPKYLVEVSKYFSESLGNRKRIDYGTGHELNFILFLFCLDKLNFFTEQDYKNLVLIVFYGYIYLMRKIQTSYWLEPAGSQGVWGLDDYHFLPFLFGSSQIVTHKHLKPKSIHSKEVLDEYSKDYLYLDMVQHLSTIKSGSLKWHSPMIDDISGAKSWQKVNNGLFKMYSIEILNKLPIMQHFLFGSIIHFDEGSLPTEMALEIELDVGEECKTGHVYAMGQEFPVCCGIRIPSVFASPSYTGYEKSPLDNSDFGTAGLQNLHIRTLPFD
ncbi:hypothetical protein BB561_000090 [Smittium simulii]|uniref:Serine/threonine-protein phosphatase 2A activator n=1 Tax=Smittium simulii TaxID=133385 RepID=A0A2T9Z0I5_9FUNG|nr:hypothetical protein BB561_000090 [Smittium simulii]